MSKSREAQLSLHKRSIAEGLSLEKEIPLKRRVMIGLLDRIGLTKEAKKTASENITGSFNGIVEKMEAAIEDSPGWDTTDSNRAECLVFWGGSDERDPKHAINVEYSKSENGGTVVAIDAGPAIAGAINGEAFGTPDPVYSGRTVLERGPEGELGIDIDGSGSVVPLQEVGAVDSTLLSPLLDGVRQDIGSRGNDIVVSGADRYPVAA